MQLLPPAFARWRSACMSHATNNHKRSNIHDDQEEQHRIPDYPLTNIHESRTNPRRTFDESKLAELAESLRTQGLIQPITVRRDNEGYEIVAGARRFRAARLAEMDEVPVRIVLLSDEQALEWQLIELSIVGKIFLCLYATLHVVYM